ncbi:hydrolase [Corynebacterium renale]|uniref:Hippurate hydrolase n=1 Tax=Corynebacterium renale TaxID=1724 RepID=A0A2A9DML4_9CORY|nr:M20 family metallopeptidase [Corynebacterium renale]PFG27844.1 hippurate hydrolase [Corynebacterium renale]SQG63436.1 hydrolase [Corynebacterium renale]SQI22031.1 hydrolase [Corynebacterium renale]
MTTPEIFRQDAAELLPELQEFRRDLHRNPELGNNLPRTQQKVLDALEGLPLEITVGEKITSVTAVLRGGKSTGASVLLRGDMDALAVQEETDEPFASEIDGLMHGCGHDMHTAGLVGAARLLCAHRDELAGDVIFMFQPGEEGPGGAEPMIQEGVLEASGSRPIAAYALHVGPQDKGTFHYIDGPVTSATNNVTITVHGVGGHASNPSAALDPVTIAAEIILAFQTGITRGLSALRPVVISVTNLRSGDGAYNAIPREVVMGASVRVLHNEDVDLVEERMRRIAEGVAAAHGATVTVDFDRLYPAAATDPAENQFAARLFGEMFGEECLRPLDVPYMGSEDFGYVLKEIPGTFMFYGAGYEHIPESEREWNHSPYAKFDDSVLGDQAAALAAVAFERLKHNQ